MKLKVLTLNIWGGRFLDRVIDLIRYEHPDIALLQEVYDGAENPYYKYKSIGSLREKLNYPHYAYEPTYINTRLIGNVTEGNAILSNFKIKKQRAIFFDIPFGEISNKFEFAPRNMLKVALKIGDKDCNVYNLHGIWGFNSKDNERRILMSKIVVNEIKNKKNVILAGDFNVNPNTQTVKNIEVYLKNVFNNELISTFNMRYKKLPGYSTAPVDMILVSKNIKIINHYMPDADVSDHMPLVCKLEV